MKHSQTHYFPTYDHLCRPVRFKLFMPCVTAQYWHSIEFQAGHTTGFWLDFAPIRHPHTLRRLWWKFQVKHFLRSFLTRLGSWKFGWDCNIWLLISGRNLVVCVQPWGRDGTREPPIPPQGGTGPPPLLLYTAALPVWTSACISSEHSPGTHIYAHTEHC